MDRDLYYIPEEDMDEVVHSQIRRKKFGSAQMILSFICAFLFCCTDVENYEIPWWFLLVGLFFLINGIRMLKDFHFINDKYGLNIW